MSRGTDPPPSPPSLGARNVRRSRFRRPAFWLFAAAVFVATHYPKLRIRSDLLPRPDLLMHASVFGAWTLLLGLSGLVGSARRVPTWLRAGLVALVYAALDEASQAIPWLHRTAALDDFGANAVGIVAVSLGGAAIVRWRRPQAGDGGAGT